ncbi:MAG: hypothetical protein IKF72_03730 [Kiritimatiellae bacterium]|nr:hypothetical protein [Kiritimatiellia bacterium]
MKARSAGCLLWASLLLASVAAGGVLRSRSVTASECGELAPQAGGRLALPAFGGEKVTLTLGARTESVTGHASYGGRSLGSPVRNATVVETPSGFVATVTDMRTRHVFVFRWDGESLRVSERTPPGGKRHCGAKSPSVAPPEKPPAAMSASSFSKSAKIARLTGDPLVDGREMLSGETLTNVVDVLFAFDKSGAEWVRAASSFAGEKNAVGLFAEDRIANMNNVLANSGLADRFSFRLAGTVAVSSDARTVRTAYGSADLDAISDYLAGVRTDSDSARAADWKRIRNKRKAVGADLVTFLVKSAEQGLVGIGFALDDDSIFKADFPDYAYNVCAVSVAAYDCTIAHECGHNMGAGHAKMRDSDSSGPQLYGYSVGHYFDVTNAEGVVVDHCTTVMGYNNDGRSSEHAKAWREYAMSHHVTVNGRRTRLIDSAYYDSNWSDGEYRETSHFSSPAVGCLYDDPVSGVTVRSGVPTGTASHDNARLLGLTYPLVANYRLHKDALLVSCNGSGSVEGGGLYVPGKRAKLVATPKKGYVFCGWYADAKMRSPLPGLWQADSYSYAVPAGGATVYAKFRKKTSEAAQKLSSGTDAGFYALTPGEARTIPLNVAAGCLPAVVASNLPGGMSLKRLGDGSWVIAGTPTARGEWTVSLSVSTAARPGGVVVAFDVLVGEWNGPTPAEASVRMRTGTGAYETLAEGSTNVVTVGVKQRLALRCADMAGEADPYVVEGLPPGLSCAGGVISGVPTASGLYRVRVAARKSWKWDCATSFSLRVRPLPAWAKGTFVGSGLCTNSLSAAGRCCGPATLTVGSTGKVSGKMRLNRGGTATFSFGSYTARFDGTLTANGTAKVVKGGKTCKFAMTLEVSDTESGRGVASLTMLGSDGNPAREFGWDVVGAAFGQVRWKGSDKALAAALDGKSLVVSTRKSDPSAFRYKLTLAFGPNGSVKVKYRVKDVAADKWLSGSHSASGTVVLLSEKSGGFSAGVPLLLKKPAAECAEVSFSLSPQGDVSSPVAHAGFRSGTMVRKSP